MEPHRNFSDDRGDRWYPADSDWDRRGYGDDHNYPESGGYRAPDPRGGSGRGFDSEPDPLNSPRYPEVAVDPRRSAGSTGRMPPVPPDAPADDPLRHQTEAIDRSALRRNQGQADPSGPAVYRTRRTGLAVAIAVLGVVFEVIALRMLAVAWTHLSVSGTIASTFFALGLPMFALGLYGLLTGAAGAAGPGSRVWLRTPLVYLPVALALFVASGVAAAGAGH